MGAVEERSQAGSSRGKVARTRDDISRRARSVGRSRVQEARAPYAAALRAKIESLADDPRPVGVRLLSAEERIYRLRVGDYRILYQVNDRVLTILVIAIGHRREVDRKIE